MVKDIHSVIKITSSKLDSLTSFLVDYLKFPQKLPLTTVTGCFCAFKIEIAAPIKALN